jgi:hydroxybutyrate-dimer hydrolase
MMYTNAFGRFSITDNLCGMSLAAVNVPGDIVPTVAEAKASSFATGNGVANGIPASVIYNASVGGAKCGPSPFLQPVARPILHSMLRYVSERL